jgi:hypothetical protein
MQLMENLVMKYFVNEQKASQTAVKGQRKLTGGGMENQTDLEEIHKN